MVASSPKRQMEMVVCASDIANADYGQLRNLRVNTGELLALQVEIAASLKRTYEKHKHVPALAHAIRVHSAGCRDQLIASTRIISKLGQSASGISNMMPDLRLAVEEGEPSLAKNVSGGK